MTFYRHFTDKEEVFQYYLSSVMDNFIERLNKIESPTLENIIFLRFQILRENLLHYKFIKLCNIDTIFVNFRRYNILTSSKCALSTMDDYKLEYRLGGIDYFTKYWVKNGMQESVEEITQKLLDII
jgi:AcrR family transcriptional regulator